MHALKQTLTNLKKHYLLFLISSSIEVLFFYLLTRLHVETFKAAAKHIKEAQNVIQSQIDKLTQQQYASLDKVLLGNADFALQYHEIIKYVGLFILGLTLIWLILRALNWLIAHKIAQTKIASKEFAKRFILFSAIGFALFSAALIACTGMLNYAAYNPLPIINAKTANIIFGLMIISIHYFLTTAFAMPKNSKFTDIKKCVIAAKKILPAYLISNIILAILLVIPALMMKNYKWVGLAIAIFVTIPMITITRIYLISVQQNN